MSQIIRDVAAAFLAVLIVVALLLVILFDVVNGKEVKIPSELSLPASLIVGFFFGQHAVSNGAANARQTAATTAAAIVNGNDATTPKPLS